jgi:hypothetical protein
MDHIGDYSSSAPPFKIVKVGVMKSTWNGKCIRCKKKLDIWGVYCERCYIRIRSDS